MESVVLVGAGKFCNNIVRYFCHLYSPVLIADNKVSKFEQYKVIKIESLKDDIADKFVITSNKFKQELFDQLISLGIDSSKIYMPDKIEYLLKEVDKSKFDEDMKKYKEMFDFSIPQLSNFQLKSENIYPVLNDYRQMAGSVDSHYFYMDIIAASLIIKNNTKMHYDIGSRVDGFVSHLLAAGIETTLIDIRPLSINKICQGGQIHFLQGDAMNLSAIASESLHSLSSLHAIEHFGLGRYGDSIDPMAPFKAMWELQRVLAKNGYLYFAVPVGKNERLCFNAHRVFDVHTITSAFSELCLEKFFLIHNGETHEYSQDDVDNSKYNDLIGYYDCGVFVFRK